MEDSKSRLLARLLFGGLITLVPMAAEVAATEVALPAYTQAEWSAQLEQWQSQAEQARRLRAASAKTSGAQVQTSGQIEKLPATDGATHVALLAPGTVGDSSSLDSVTVSGSGVMPAESITNLQTAGIDEGGIVKLHGSHLVVLRRGRLFSIDTRAGALQLGAAVDAFGPGTDPDSAWYDEMLISGDTIVVIGYDYGQDATGIGLFDIDAAGAIRYRQTYYLRSDDYYSASNSTSRLVGDTLVFYAPLRLYSWSMASKSFYPSVARATGTTAKPDYLPTLATERIYRSSREPMRLDDGPSLHVVTRCKIASPELACQSSAVLGPDSREFYVSGDAVYVWTSARRASNAQQAPASSVYRLPFDGSAPRSLQTQGGPIDQFSFLQDAGGYLNVLVVADSKGGGMWSSERNQGATALLRVPLTAFGGLGATADRSDYHPLPRASGSSVRFIGAWLLYDGHRRDDDERDEYSEANRPRPLHALRYTQPASVQTLQLPHWIARIEALGGNGIVVGESPGEDLHFTSVRLGERAQISSGFIQPRAAQGETRSHGFFYKPADESSGILGLPIMRQAPVAMQRYLRDSAAVVYLRNRDLHLSPMGQLEAASVSEAATHDGCIVSCVDWYGNARPIFLGDRVFALLGYELVEGKVAGERIVERQRVDFAPRRTSR